MEREIVERIVEIVGNLILERGDQLDDKDREGRLRLNETDQKRENADSEIEKALHGKDDNPIYWSHQIRRMIAKIQAGEIHIIE